LPVRAHTGKAGNFWQNSRYFAAFQWKEVARTGGPDFAKGVYAIKTFDPGSSSRLRYSQTNQYTKGIVMVFYSLIGPVIH
jgi:hypothetical protein|tara:strand:+ start:108 stop:347 length:240 start_codon:yes stop_codon:yes gene_type:complete